MKSFSQRKGIKPVKNVIQLDSMDSELRNSLWNRLTLHYWSTMQRTDILRHAATMHALFTLLWLHYFKSPLDTMPDHWDRAHRQIRQYFFDCQWYEVYDLIEFIATRYYHESVNREFMDSCNSVLERELSAYRFVGGEIAPITSAEEIAEIEEALEASTFSKLVSNHLKRALDLLADRKSPDYRNSIKEAISAVEAICRSITGKPRATLGEALTEIENKVGLHPAFKSALNKLYGYTSDAEGIRHALLDQPNLNFEDAKFMLVSCSAFINYIMSKSSRAGIKL